MFHLVVQHFMDQGDDQGVIQKAIKVGRGMRVSVSCVFLFPEEYSTTVSVRTTVLTVWHKGPESLGQCVDVFREPGDRPRGAAPGSPRPHRKRGVAATDAHHPNPREKPKVANFSDSVSPSLARRGLLTQSCRSC